MFSGNNVIPPTTTTPININNCTDNTELIKLVKYSKSFLCLATSLVALTPKPNSIAVADNCIKLKNTAKTPQLSSKRRINKGNNNKKTLALEKYTTYISDRFFFKLIKYLFRKTGKPYRVMFTILYLIGWNFFAL